MQDFRAVSFSLDRMFDGLNLPAYAADAIEHLLFVPDYVRQEPPPQFSWIVYPTRYMIFFVVGVGYSTVQGNIAGWRWTPDQAGKIPYRGIIQDRHRR
jgi:hypothetical protein